MQKFQNKQGLLGLMDRMRTGSQYGRNSCLVLDAFVTSDGAYTSISVALALLLSMTLVFSAATGTWLLSRSGETQYVADASSLAAQNVVSAYATIFQVVDACVLSLGLTGVLLYGAGLICSAIPGLRTAALPITDTAHSILQARKDFCATAQTGLETLEKLLPAASMANSYLAVKANSENDISYIGLAIPFPQESSSSFAMSDELDDAELQQQSLKMQEKSDEAKEQADRASAAKERGWLADCGSSPYCLYERVGRLSNAGENRHYASSNVWNFGAPILRARSYYASRIAIETPHSASIEEIVDSVCRVRFYEFALTQVNTAYYRELPDGSVDLFFPELPKNTDEVRRTSLYTDAIWPSSIEAEGLTLHASTSCPGAQGERAGNLSLASIDSGQARECRVCKMSVGDLGKTVSASSVIDNGFEYWWAEVVSASKEYKQATNELANTQNEMKDLAEKSKGAFEQALESLSVDRPTICPIGAWGSVAVVARADGVVSPAGLAGSFVPQTSLPLGAALSAAVLAPDSTSDGLNVLAGFLDGLNLEDRPLIGVLDSVCALWGDLLVSYGSAYTELGGIANSVFEKVDFVFGASVAEWLKTSLSDLIEKTGFCPVDMRQRKPVLTNTQNVFEKSGYSHMEDVYAIAQALPANGSAQDIARALGRETIARLDDPHFTLAELPIPGTDISIPLTIDLREVVGAL